MDPVLIKDSSQLTHKFPNDFNTSSQDSSIFAENSSKTLTKGFRKAYKSTPIKLAKGFESHTRITLCYPTKITLFEHRDVLYL